MKNIAIFVSGEGHATERVVKLFNEGNRVHTVLVVMDESSTDLPERLKEEDVTLLHVTEEDWKSHTQEIASLLKEKDVKLLVLDNFDLVIPDEIMETTAGEFIRVTSYEQAPREVVAALEAELRKPVEEIKTEENETEPDPTPESEWADALKIQFTPPKVPSTPPEIPAPEVSFNNPNFQENRNRNFEFSPFKEKREDTANEPMPSTYLIWSILVTIFCCFIPGIIAIIFSSMVSSKYYIGDIDGSRRASRQAEIWIIVSVVLGVLAATLYIPFMLIS